LTNWSFNQLCGLAGNPPGFIQQQPATLAAQNLNWGLKTRNKFEGEEKDCNLLIQSPSDPDSLSIVRAINGSAYKRIWDLSVVEKLEQLPGNWKNPPGRPPGGYSGAIRKATMSDVLQYCSHPSLGIKVGDDIAPSGLYRSDRDLFIFMVDDSPRVVETGTGRTLARGLFLWNSEVGGRTWGMARFMFDSVCGNHIIWGSSQYAEIRFRHVGNVLQRIDNGILVQVRDYLSRSESQDRAIIERAKTHVLGKDRDEVADFLQIRRKLPKKVIDLALVKSEQNVDSYGDPRSIWGVVNGLTEVSQLSEYADTRTELDQQAGSLLQLCWN
jgi:hypothetical protein